MKRNLVLSDIHGMRELQILLEKIGYAPGNDILTVLGDYIDRGPNSKEVVELLMELQRNYSFKVTLLRGNHEEMCLQAHDHPTSDNVNMWL